MATGAAGEVLQNESFRYSAYGLGISSEFAFWSPGVASATDRWQPDVRVALERSGSGGTPAVEGAIRFAWPDLAEIVVRSGHQICVAPAVGAEPTELAAAISGLGLAAVLGQRELLVLHGTCVAFGSGAVCLVGPSGAGKSTLLTACCAAGGRLVSDTMTVVELRGEPWVHPGPGQIKLWPDAAATYGYEPASDARVLPESEKRVYPFIGAVAGAPTKLARVFVLAETGKVGATRLAPAPALVALMENHFLAGYFGTAERAKWLPSFAHLVEVSDVYRLDRGHSLSDIASVVEILRA